MDNCCDSLIKYIIFIFNFFFLLTGIALISIGSYMKVEMSNYLNFLDDTYMNTSVLFIILGIIILIIGFCGCCGAMTENFCMMFTFATLLGLVVIIQIASAVMVYMYQDDAEEQISNKMKEGMRHYDPDSTEYEGVTMTWNQIQSDLKCCGVDKYEDWKTTNFSKPNGDVPDDCCKTISKGCGSGVLNDPTKVDGIYEHGCLKKLESLIGSNIEYVGGAGIAFILLEIIGVLVSCMLASNMRRRSNYV